MNIPGNDVLIRQRFIVLMERLFNLPRRAKQAVLMAWDLCAIPLAALAALLVRRADYIERITYREGVAVAITVAVSAYIFLRTGLYRAVVRYMGQQAILTVVRGVTWSAVVLLAALFILRSDMPRSLPLIYWAVALCFIGGSRLLIRSGYQDLHRWTGKKVAIYGAGSSGRQLLHSLFQSGEFAPMAFLDDNANLQNTVINGIPVSSPEELPRLINDLGITYVLLAIPTVNPLRRRQILDVLAKLPVQVKTIPSFSALVSGLAQVDDIGDVEIEDLLGRTPVPPQPELLTRCIADKVVAVTGAGGSIGSELCRQIIANRPRRLVLIDSSEYSLYEIGRELEAACATGKVKAEVVPLLGNVQNEEKMQSIFERHGVETVYHAAAYKHVPIVEANIAEGAENNIFGTLAASRAAARSGVTTFVLISTDKAVRPTNIMGASKRVAELIVQAAARKYPATAFSVVRFGNVLGSSGSVVPLFREQITRGGPVTITHPDVIRYFMTIPEAAQLVLQAGAMGGDGAGDVFVLDMGEPVKIVELAKRMIKLMGRTLKDETNHNGDIEISYVGLRPGEKLFEELLISDCVVGTSHSKILQAQEEWLSEEVLRPSLKRLKRACDNGDNEGIRSVLVELVAGFRPLGSTAKSTTEEPAFGRQRVATAKVYPLFSNE